MMNRALLQMVRNTRSFIPKALRAYLWSCIRFNSSRRAARVKAETREETRKISRIYCVLIVTMLDNIEFALREQCGLNKKHPVIAGVSGGPDSLCLMSVLRKAGYRVIVAHFNHKLRHDSDADANIVEQTASRLNLASIVESADVRSFANSEKLSIEEAARIMRYRYFIGQARRFNAQAVAVGHTADDQVETVLMHFIRGAGLAGLKGMNYRTVINMFDSDIPIIR